MRATKDVMTSYIKDIEKEITMSIRKTVPAEVTGCALGNLLIRMLIKENVPKEHFLKKMSEGWDWHAENVKNGE